DTHTAVDDQIQLPSTIEIQGQKISFHGGSALHAPGGQLTVTANANPLEAAVHDAQSQIRMEPGASIDLSGSSTTVPMSRNFVAVELRANELRDDPAQRDGALRGKTVIVDRRVIAADGSVGTAIADVSGAIKAIPKSVAERMAAGGTAKFSSEGDIVVANDA